MSQPAISVRHVGKRYRIGAAQSRAETLVGAALSWLRTPLANFRRLRSLSTFAGDGSDPDVLWALQDVSFDVEPGAVVGLIGRNGAGKSTLLKILARITRPTSGFVGLNGRVASLLEVGTGFHPELSGRENIYLNGSILGMRKVEIDRKFDEIVDFSGVDRFLETPIKRYSTGMRVRLAFAVAAHLESEILLVDEVLAVGDLAFQKKCLGKMESLAQTGRTVLFVSHDMGAVIHLCPHSLVLEHGQVLFSGPTEQAVAAYQQSIAGRMPSASPHILYEDNEPVSEEARVVRIELLDAAGGPKPALYTWDDCTVRIHYSAVQDYPTGAVLIYLRNQAGQTVALFNSGLKAAIAQGDGFVDCQIRRLPLAAGEYRVDVGLAVSNWHWIWLGRDLSLLTVLEKDVFGIGRPPKSTHMAVAVEHSWHLPNGRP